LCEQPPWEIAGPGGAGGVGGGGGGCCAK